MRLPALPQELREMLYDQLQPDLITIHVRGQDWAMPHAARSVCQQLHSELEEKTAKIWLRDATTIKATVTDFDCRGLISLLEGELASPSVARRTVIRTVDTTELADQHEHNVDEWFAFLAKDPDMRVSERQCKLKGFVLASKAQQDLLDKALDRAYDKNSQDSVIYDFSAMISASIRVIEVVSGEEAVQTGFVGGRCQWRVLGIDGALDGGSLESSDGRRHDAWTRLSQN